MNAENAAYLVKQALSRVGDLLESTRPDGKHGRPRPSKLDADSNSNLNLSLGIGITETKAFITGRCLE